MRRSLTEDQIQEVIIELRAGHKLAAIKRCREHLGCSLATAKGYVEGLAAGQHLSVKDIDVGIDDAQLDEILDEIHAGKKLNAVKIYKEAKGVSLMEAKEFVEKLMRELEIAQPGSVPRASGCNAITLMLIMLATIWAIGAFVSR